MKLGIMGKMMLFIMAPALLGLGAVAAISFLGSQNVMVSQIRQDMQLIAENQSINMAAQTETLQNVLHNSASNENMPNFLRLSSGDDAEALKTVRAAALSRMQSLAKSFPLFSHVGIINSEGVCVLHTNPKMINVNLKDRTYFQASIKGQTAAFSAHSRGTGLTTTMVSVPIKQGNTIVGVFYGTLDLAQLAALTVDPLKAGKSGISFVYDRTGLMLMHPNRDYLGNKDGNLDWVKTILSQRNGRLEYTWKDVSKIAYFSHVPSMDWYFVLSVERDEALAPLDDILRNVGIAGGIATLIVSIIIFLVAKGIASTLVGGSQLVGHVAEGNMTLTEQQQQTLTTTSKRGDEIGALARGIGSMLENIRKLFDESAEKAKLAEQATEEARQSMLEAEQARQAAEHAKRDGMLSAAAQLEGVAANVSSASSQLARQVEQAEHGADQSAQRLAQAATAMNQMNATVQEVAKSASSASHASSLTREKAENGSHIVGKSLSSIEQVHQVSVELKENMTTLNEHTQSITHILGVISDIADQTNLLALNAAIEAARAGDAGRGFAVVADEVRKLAEKTMVSTSEVGNAIKAIQTSATRSVNSVNEAVEKIAEATTFAQESGAALQEIVTTVDSTADQVNAIATACEEQSAASEEINQSLVEVNTTARQTSQAMAESAKAVSELTHQAQALNTLIDEMKKG